jgi:hypothetical protein
MNDNDKEFEEFYIYIKITNYSSLLQINIIYILKK